MRNLIFLALICCIAATGCADNQSTTNDTPQQKQPSAPPQSKLDEKGTGKLMSVVSDYYELKDALVATDAGKADAAAKKLMASADSLRAMLAVDTANKTGLTLWVDTIQLSAQSLVAEQDPTTEKKRVHFEKVSDAVFALLKSAELRNAGIYRQYCPMAFNDKGAFWLSSETDIKNPYFGKKMLECGEVTDSLK